MPRYIVYDTTTGEIVRFVEVPVTDINDNVELGEDFLFASGLTQNEVDDYYVDVDGSPPTYEIRKKRQFPDTWDKLFIVANGVDTATLNNVPNPSTLILQDTNNQGVVVTQIEDVTDGIAEVTLDFDTTSGNGDGNIQVTASSPTYKDYVEFIQTTGAQEVLMVTREIDIQTYDVNITNRLVVDSTADITITTYDVSLISGEIIDITSTVDITITAYDVVLNQVETVNVDSVKKIFVVPYTVQLFNTDTLTVSSSASITLSTFDVDLYENTTVNVERKVINVTTYDVDYFDYGVTVPVNTQDVNITTYEVTV